MKTEEVAGIVRDLYLRYGKELFADNYRLKAYLSDYLAKYPLENRLLSNAIDCGICQRLLEDHYSDSELSCYVKDLADSFGIEMNKSREAVRIMYFSVFGNMPRWESADKDKKLFPDSGSHYSDNRSPTPKAPSSIPWLAVIAASLVLIAVILIVHFSNTDHVQVASESHQEEAAVSHKTEKTSAAPEKGTDSVQTVITSSTPLPPPDPTVPLTPDPTAPPTPDPTVPPTPDPTAPPTEKPLTASVSKSGPAVRTKIVPASAEASSFINSNHIGERGVVVRYASCAIDGDSTTSWQEAATGYGIDQWIKITLSDPAEISYLSFQLGNCYDSKSYKENGRPSQLRIDFSDGSSVICDFSDKMTEYIVTLSEPVTASWVKFTILGAYMGSKYEDTCISEIGLYS